LDVRGTIATVLLLGAAALAGTAAVGAAQGCTATDGYTATWAIQGAGNTSPLESETVDEVRGLVTQDAQDGVGPDPKRGVFVQAHEPDCDEDTSDGLFVYTGYSAEPVEPGDLVAIREGTVTEWGGPYWADWPRTETQLDCRDGCTVEVLDTGRDLPEPLAYDPPTDEDAAAAYDENREGMRVAFEQPATALGPTDEHHSAPVVVGEDAPRAFHGHGPHGEIVRLDGSAASAASGSCSSGTPDLRTYDGVPHRPAEGVGVTGALAYGWRADRVIVDATARCPEPEDEAPPYAPAEDPLPDRASHVLNLATYNLENFWTTDGYPSMGYDAYQTKLAKTARSICSAEVLDRPELVAVQEVGNETVLADVADEVADRCDVGYEVASAETPGFRQQGVMVRTANATLVDLQPRQGCSDTDRGVTYGGSDAEPSADCDGEEEHYLFNRPPLEATVRVEDADRDPEVTVYVNHWKSKIESSGCENANCSGWRVEQARHVADLVRDELDEDPQARVAVVGDLNSDVEDPAAGELAEGPVANLWDQLPAPPEDDQGAVPRYSHLHRGVASSLDHVLVTDGLMRDGVDLHPRHVNADWPASHADDDGTYLSTSDHDPLVALVDLPAPPAPPTAAVEAGCERLTCTFDAANATDPIGDGLAYTWDLDDGTRATGERVEHTYESEGTYEVTLEVEDARGRTDTATTTVEPCRVPRTTIDEVAPIARWTTCDALAFAS
jgi:predicted extracellular nuclease